MEVTYTLPRIQEQTKTLPVYERLKDVNFCFVKVLLLKPDFLVIFCQKKYSRPLHHMDMVPNVEPNTDFLNYTRPHNKKHSFLLKSTSRTYVHNSLTTESI